MSFLRNDRLQPCIVKNLFEHVLMTRLNHPSLSQLRNTVQNWTQFTANSMATCVERTRQGHAVYFGAAGILEKYVASSEGRVQISHLYADDMMFPASLLLPKASPYKELLNSVTIRLVETGLIEQFKALYWRRNLTTTRNVAPGGDWQPLQLNESVLASIILAAGLGASSVVFLCEVLWGILKGRRRQRPFLMLAVT
ncbi:uncharacterized protein LOC125940217 [Dermacentor silvarum]|uniref:uncharacterized protein LOC125940217 n=1 Tax=Dermacentor silvarum TaxID=543639 RepID=UPI002101B9C3|nr:uncharacterized protein LOC125940217 [Dermacentor silvarum]